MARPSSKIMTLADKKAAVGNLKTLLKQQAAATKDIEAGRKQAAKDLAAAKKAADARSKEAAKDLAAAQKLFDSVVAKADKAAAAAAKGTEKINSQLEALESAQVAPKAKGKAAAAATA